MELVPPEGAATTIASSTDPETGITTTSVGKPDGSRVVSKTDSEGNILSTELIPSKGAGTSIASSTDPKTGITTSAQSNPDGTRTITKSQTRKDPDGTVRITATDDQGNRTETVANKDGTTTVTQTTPTGEKVTTHQTPDGAISIVEDHPGGSKTTTHRDPDGRIVTEKFDHNGNRRATITRVSDSEEIREDTHGNVTRVTSADGRTTESTTDRRGNSTTITRDAAGEIVAREENRVTPKEPGQQYFETALNGTDWDALPPSLKSRYAGTESQMRGNEEMQKLRDAQEAERKRVAEESRKFSEDQQAKTDAKLTTIQDEQKEADRKAAERAARDERERQVKASYETAAKLESDYADAMKRGDKAEAKRIMDLQDAHHDASTELLEFNDEEKRAMERKQALRDNLTAEIIASARADAETRVGQDWEQDLKESVTSGGKHISLGAAMQQETKKSTRQADLQAAFGEAKKERLLKRLDDPKTTPEERAIIGGMLDMSDVQLTGAYEQLAANDRLTAAGYAIDVAMLAGGPISKGVGMLGSKVMATAVGKGVTAGARTVVAAARTTAGGAMAADIAQGAGKLLHRGVGDLAASGTLAVTERLAGKEAAQLLGAQATAAAGLARGAATRVGDTALAKALGKDVMTGAQAESRWLTGVVEESVKDMVVGTGAQVAMTGKVDIEDVVLGGMGGGLLGGTMSAAMKANPSLGKPQGGPASAKTPGELPAASSGGATSRPGVPAPMAAPKPERLVAANTPAQPSPRPARPAGETLPAAPTTANTVPARPQPKTPVGESTPPPAVPGDAVARPVQSPRAPAPASSPELPSTPANKAPALTVSRNPTAPASPAPVAESTPPAGFSTPAPKANSPRTGPGDTEPGRPLHTVERPGPRAGETTPAPQAPDAVAMLPKEPRPRIVYPGDPDYHPAVASPGPARAETQSPNPKGDNVVAADRGQPTSTSADTRTSPAKAGGPETRTSVPKSASAETRTSVPRGDDTRTMPNQPDAPAPAAAPPRHFYPDAPTAINPPGPAPRAQRSTAETRARVRDTVPKAAQESFDETMAAVDRLIEADPRFADVDHEQVAQQALIRAGNMKPEAAAALALNYQGHRGARVTPEALAHVTGLPRAEAEAAIRTGWDAVRHDPGDIHNPGPKPAGPAAPSVAENSAAPPAPPRSPDEPIMVEEFDPNAPDSSPTPPSPRSRPMVEEFDPTADSTTGVAPKMAKAAKDVAKDADAYARQYAEAADKSIRQAAEAARVRHRARVEQAEVLGTFRDSPDLTPTGLANLRNPNVRKLIPGDSEHLNNLMSDVRIPFPDGRTRLLKPSQLAIGAEAANDFAVKILNSEPGAFPPSVENPSQRIEIYPDGTIGEGGHHRMIGAMLASAMSGRPLYGGVNPIIPANQIDFVPKGVREPMPNWGLKVEPPLATPERSVATNLAEKRSRAEDLRRQADSGSSSDPNLLRRQAAHLEWEAQAIENQ